MHFTPASPASVAAFVIIVVAVIAAFLSAVQYSFRSKGITAIAAGALALWLGLLSVLIGTGTLPKLPLHGLPQFFGSILLICTIAALSPFGRRLALNVPITALVGFAAFRLPLEFVLHSWVEQGTIPATMTWTGQNWDVISGITALLCAPFARRHRAIAWLANLVGAALLLNVIRVAFMSSPLPIGWPVRPPLLLAHHLPYAFIGPVCVGGALFGHLVLTRALLARR